MVSVIKSNFAYTPSMDKFVFRENAFMVVEDGTIKGIYDKLPEKYASFTAENYEKNFFIPAFCDIHIHAPQYPKRGIGFNKELLPWLEEHVFPLEAMYKDSEIAELCYKEFLNSLWRAGTIRANVFATIHKKGTEILFSLFEKSGLMGYAGKVNMDRNSPPELLEDTEISLVQTKELIEEVSTRNKRVKYIITPRFVPATSSQLMKGLGDLAEKYDLPVQSHLCENRNEVKWVAGLHPDIPSFTEVYDRYGLLRKGRTIMAHSIYLTNRERDILKEKNILLAHCAQSNSDLASGIMPVRINLSYGLWLGIASDIGGGHVPNINRHIVEAIQASKLNWVLNPEQKPLTLAEAFFLATKSNGRFFGNVGSFEEGCDFDALMIEDESPLSFMKYSLMERVEQFLYCGDDRNIVKRYCQGEEIKKPF